MCFVSFKPSKILEMSSLVFLVAASEPHVGIGSVFVAFGFSLEVAMLLSLKHRY